MRISNLNAAICRKGSRQLQLARLTLACLVLVLCGSVWTGSANAQDCEKVKTADADGILTLDAGVTNVESASVGGLYSIATPRPPSVNCRKWVVDVAVPSTSTAGGQYYSRAIGFSSSGDVPATKADCLSYFSESQFFMKGPGQPDFMLITQKKSNGVWHPKSGIIPSHCSIGEFYPLVNPPTSGYVVYRLASTAKLNRNFTTVRVTGSHPSQPG